MYHIHFFCRVDFHVIRRFLEDMRQTQAKNTPDTIMSQKRRYATFDTVFRISAPITLPLLRLPGDVTFSGNEAHECNTGTPTRGHIGTQTRRSESGRHARAAMLKILTGGPFRIPIARANPIEVASVGTPIGDALVGQSGNQMMHISPRSVVSRMSRHVARSRSQERGEDEAPNGGRVIGIGLSA